MPAGIVQRAQLILALPAMLVALQAIALDKDEVHVREEGRAYRIRMAFDVPATVEQVKSVLTDFTHPSRLNSAVQAREVLGQQEGIVRVRTEIRDCVVFFCKTMVLVQDVTVAANEVHAEVVPDTSDFRHGVLRWSIDNAGSGVSHVVFEAFMEPNFFVPPIIGDFLLRTALRKQVLATAEKLVIEAPREPRDRTE